MNTKTRGFRLSDERFERLRRLGGMLGCKDVTALLVGIADGELSVTRTKKAPLPREEERDSNFDWGA